MKYTQWDGEKYVEIEVDLTPEAVATRQEEALQQARARAALPKPLRSLPNDLEREYREWKAENPAVYAKFRQMAQEALVAQHKFGIQQLAEMIRWDMTVRVRSTSFKINNNFLAYIARDLLQELPALAKLMRTRAVRT